MEAKAENYGPRSHVMCYRHKLKLVAFRSSYGNLSCVIVRTTFKMLTLVRYECDVDVITGVGWDESGVGAIPRFV